MTLAWITGVHGFIGRHLAARLAGAGVEVAGIGIPGADPTPAPVAVCEASALDDAGLDRLLARTGPPEAIYHLAGGASVPASVKDPDEDFRRTVAGTRVLLGWMHRRTPAARVVLASSAAVYGNRHHGLIREEDGTDPVSPYGRHKLLAEEALIQGARQGLAVAAVRLFSAYGPGLERQLLWDVCRRLAQGEAVIEVAGTGEERRDWLHVDDAAGLLMLAARQASTGAPVVNGGAGQPVRVLDLVTAVCAAWGGGAQVRCTGLVRPGDPFSLVADITRARAWGWRPEVEFHDGVAATVAWCRRRLGKS